MTSGLMDALYLLILILGGYLFWQWRLQEESARRHAETVCKQYKVQFLDIARSGGRLRLTPRTGWEAQFQFGFSSDTKSRYEGEITLLNLHLRDVKVPPHRSAPEPNSSNTVDGIVVSSASSPERNNSPEREGNSPEREGNSPEPTENPEQTSENGKNSLASRSNLHNIPAPAIAWNVSYGDRPVSQESSEANDDIIEAIFPNDTAGIANEETDPFTANSEPFTKPFPMDGSGPLDG